VAIEDEAEPPREVFCAILGDLWDVELLFREIESPA
jgi:hypothetical protein